MHDRARKHQHGNAIEPWPFEGEPSSLVITTKRVVEGTSQITGVVHGDDGDWQFLDGGSAEADDGIMVCFECLVTSHPDLTAFRDLPIGWQSWVSDAGIWRRMRYEDT